MVKPMEYLCSLTRVVALLNMCLGLLLLTYEMFRTVSEVSELVSLNCTLFHNEFSDNLDMIWEAVSSVCVH